MRAFAACFVAVLGLGALTSMAACSDATDTGSGGAGGATAEGGAKATAGAPASAGTGGKAAVDCKFESDACQTCIGSKCMAEAGACVAADGCATPLFTLEECACDKTMTTDSCKAAFIKDGGDEATELSTCYAKNCTASCE